MNETNERIIKKYPNRRLYDTTISSYITLEDVRVLIMDQIPFKIMDARTQNDLTHSTLLQIIIEQEEKGPSLFSNHSLQQMIRSYGGTMQLFLSKIFDQGMEFFSMQQSLMKNTNAENMDMPNNPFALWTEKNLNHWQKLQQDWLSTLTPQGVQPKKEPPPEEF